MSRKSILFLMNGLICGGVERAFLSSLSLIDPEEFDVTCIFMRRKGDLFDNLPSWVRSFELPLQPLDRVEYENGRVAALKHAVKMFKFGFVLEMLLSRLYWRLFKHNQPYNYLRRIKLVHRAARSLPQDLPRKYDYVFAYGGMSMVSIVAKELFKGRVECAWFHLESQPDYEGVFYYRKLYSTFNRRFCCSQKLADQLNIKWNVASGARFEFLGFHLNTALYMRMASSESGFVDDFKGFRILTVGRLCEQKGWDIAIDACYELKKKGYEIRWYWVGWGEHEIEKVRMRIRKMELNNDFILLGLKTNPFPFFKECDIYVQPSRFEGYCLTVAEARAFCRPIVCTDFAGASEQIKNGHTGIIVPEVSADAICDGVRQLLDSKNLRENLSSALSTETVDNEQRVRSAWKKLLESV